MSLGPLCLPSYRLVALTVKGHETAGNHRQFRIWQTPAAELWGVVSRWDQELVIASLKFKSCQVLHKSFKGLAAACQLALVAGQANEFHKSRQNSGGQQ